jgi:integrase
MAPYEAFTLPSGHDHRPGVKCPVCEAVRAEKLDPQQFGVLPFRLAAPLWMKETHGFTDRNQVPRNKRKTFEQHEYYIRTLLPFFGDYPLNEVHIGHVQSYVDMRLQSPRRTNLSRQARLDLHPELNFNELVGPSVVRHEVSFLGMVLDRAGLWKAIRERYTPPPLPKSTVGRALEPDEEQRLFVVACSNRRWARAYWGSLISAQTGADPGEIQHLHLNDIDLAHMTMRIRDGLKNEHRDRIIELVHLPDVVWAFKKIIGRYYKICRRQNIVPDGEHFILPGRTAGVPGYDLFKPMGSWKKAWDALRKAAELPDLRMKDLRHHALTKALENPELSERTIIEIFGHVSKAMWSTYSHIRRKPKQEAMKTLHFARPIVPPPPSVDAVETVDIPDAFGPNITEIKKLKKA